MRWARASATASIPSPRHSSGTRTDLLAPGETREVGGMCAVQLIEERCGNVVVADERVREQRLEGEAARSRHRRIDGEPLVGLDRLHEPERVLGRRCGLRQRYGA